jgi:flagellar biosynthesis/type III secretory pathway M-ring protein FliF/YscJ
MKITFYNLTWLDDLGYFTSDLTDQQVIAVYVMAGLVVLTVVSLIVTIIIRSRRRKEEQNLQNKIEENDDNVLPLSETMVEEEKISTFEERIEKFVQPVEEYVEEKEKKRSYKSCFSGGTFIKYIY